MLCCYQNTAAGRRRKRGCWEPSQNAKDLVWSDITLVPNCTTVPLHCIALHCTASHCITNCVKLHIALHHYIMDLISYQPNWRSQHTHTHTHTYRTHRTHTHAHLIWRMSPTVSILYILSTMCKYRTAQKTGQDRTGQDCCLLRCGRAEYCSNWPLPFPPIILLVKAVFQYTLFKSNYWHLIICKKSLVSVLSIYYTATRLNLIANY